MSSSRVAAHVPRQAARTVGNCTVFRPRRLQASLSVLAAIERIAGPGRPPMRHTDIAIVGGGLAGSTAAAMLGRAGVDAVLVDPHQLYPKDFRCEKLDASQVTLLRKTGLAEPVLRASTPDLEVSIVRFGRLTERRPNGQYDLLYDTLVNAMRAEVPASVPFICGKAVAIVTGAGC